MSSVLTALFRVIQNKSRACFIDELIHPGRILFASDNLIASVSKHCNENLHAPASMCLSRPQHLAAAHQLVLYMCFCAAMALWGCVLCCSWGDTWWCFGCSSDPEMLFIWGNTDWRNTSTDSGGRASPMVGVSFWNKIILLYLFQFITDSYPDLVRTSTDWMKPNFIPNTGAHSVL